MPFEEITFPPGNPQEFTIDDLSRHLRVNPAQGLTEEEAQQRRQQLGPNALAATQRDSALLVFIRQFKSLMVVVLTAAAVFSFVVGDQAEGWAIVGVVVINALIGFGLEWSASESMEALRKMDTTMARVIRDGHLREIASEDLTLGDVLVVEAGDLVPADAQLFEANQLQTDESALTGESLPVAKQTRLPKPDAPLAEQTNRLFKGTAVVSGNGKALVSAIGAQTELGKIANLVEQAQRTATPLEAKLNSLTKRLVGLTFVLATLYLLLGIWQGKEVLLMVETSIALAVAAIPEGMSIVATLALAYGMLQLAKKNVIIKQLAAVETLGGTNVIFTDKTGTLTENRITVDTIWHSQGMAEVQVDLVAKRINVLKGANTVITGPVYHELLKIAVLCNNASYHPEAAEHQETGDPVEVALLKLAVSSDVEPSTVQVDFPRLAEQAFSSDTRMMGTLHQDGEAYFVAVKGATEEILPQCRQVYRDGSIHSMDEAEQVTWQAQSDGLAKAGLRTLAFACRNTAAHPGEDFTSNLVWVGLVGFLDPPRLEVIPAIQACREAGIRVVMVTGDHPATALTVASKVNMVGSEYPQVMQGKDLMGMERFSPEEKERVFACRVFARVSPSQKLDMISLYQQRGDIVGMTGDGVNDAPALKKADIGIAMGLRGTQVASETAAIVLKDDAFASIVVAIAQGRLIFENIRKFVLYLISCNLSEILIVTVAGLMNSAFTLLPLQILFINIVTDVFPALALGVGRGNQGLMKQNPREPKLPILIRTDWKAVSLYALAMTLGVLGVVYYGYHALGLEAGICNNITFYGLMLAQLLHVFNLSSEKNFFQNEITRNRYLWWALVLCVGIMLLTYQVGFLRRVLAIQSLHWQALTLIGSAGVLPVMAVQLLRKLGLGK